MSQSLARIIDGKVFAAELRARVAAAVAELTPKGIVPGLAVVLVGDDPASQIYVRTKGRQTLEAGMRSFEHRLPATVGQAEVVELVRRLTR
jgi:methylenetetrahydrofolate dehydrogenase (NADP+)/methenyltetrahydrofolate cyclohydrolase